MLFVIAARILSTCPPLRGHRSTPRAPWPLPPYPVALIPAPQLESSQMLTPFSFTDNFAYFRINEFHHCFVVYSTCRMNHKPSGNHFAAHNSAANTAIRPVMLCCSVSCYVLRAGSGCCMAQFLLRPKLVPPLPGLLLFFLLFSVSCLYLLLHSILPSCTFPSSSSSSTRVLVASYTLCPLDFGVKVVWRAHSCY